MTAILELIEPEIAPFEPPTREPYGRTKHEVYVMTRKLAMTIQNFTYHRGVFKTPILGKGRSYGVVDGTAWKNDGIVSIALSLTILPQIGIDYLRRSNQQGVGRFRAI